MNIAEEQNIIGSILYEASFLALLPQTIKASSFSEPLHAEVFEIVSAAYIRGEALDPIAVAAKLKSGESLKHLGGLKYFADLIDQSTPVTIAPAERIVSSRAAVAKLCVVLEDAITNLLSGVRALLADIDGVKDDGSDSPADWPQPGSMEDWS